jgi:tRNA(His) guanylyltransferase
MTKNDLGDRMKRYEGVSQYKLIRRMPVIIRLDGKAFHTFTRKMEKPFDRNLILAMNDSAQFLCTQLMGCKLAYIQSDEISLLLTDYDNLETEPWFDNKIQKMVSISSSLCSTYFTTYFCNDWDMAFFDARAFNLPREEVCNYFIWRQQDWTRNSIQMLARAHFSHKQCHKKNQSELQDMLMNEMSVNWNDLPIHLKRGRCVLKSEDEGWVTDQDIPIFTKDREYIERFVF